MYGYSNVKALYILASNFEIPTTPLSIVSFSIMKERAILAYIEHDETNACQYARQTYVVVYEDRWSSTYSISLESSSIYHQE